MFFYIINCFENNLVTICRSFCTQNQITKSKEYHNLQIWHRMSEKCREKKDNRFLHLWGSLLIGLGQDQQEHPAVHSGYVSTGKHVKRYT